MSHLDTELQQLKDKIIHNELILLKRTHKRAITESNHAADEQAKYLGYYNE